MEAISFISSWITWLLLIIPVGAATTITYFALKKTFSFDIDEKAHYDTRIRQTLKGAIIGVTISGLITIIKNFYI